MTLPRLLPPFLANRAATKSGKLPAVPRPRHGCNCATISLSVQLLSWNSLSAHLFHFELANHYQVIQ
jgi:hypothetical protein